MLYLLQAPEVLQSLDGLQVAEGSCAVLTCCICGRPTPTFEWSRAGHPVDTGRVIYDQLTGNLRLEVSRRRYAASNPFCPNSEFYNITGGSGNF